MWSPNENDLVHVINMLKESQASDTQVQMRIQQKITELNKHPDFCNYLVYILVKMKSEDENTRSLSGLILKNNIQCSYHLLSQNTINYLKSDLLNTIGDQSRLVRVTTGIIIATLTTKCEADSWPELLTSLCELFDSNDGVKCEGMVFHC